MSKRALVRVRAPGNPGGGARSMESFMLAEGQRAGEVAVVEINERGGVVKSLNSGQMQVLSPG